MVRLDCGRVGPAQEGGPSESVSRAKSSPPRPTAGGGTIYNRRALRGLRHFLESEREGNIRLGQRRACPVAAEAAGRARRGTPQKKPWAQCIPTHPTYIRASPASPSPTPQR